ncbi:hypothetical protein J4475_02185 [Candidatus Woesearchaeota archaeon]|nr:hypothetical protein [Candidatus Woesearchaeota archaeon]
MGLFERWNPLLYSVTVDSPITMVRLEEAANAAFADGDLGEALTYAEGYYPFAEQRRNEQKIAEFFRRMGKRSQDVGFRP